MSRRLFPWTLFLAVAFGLLGALGIQAPAAHAGPLDVCQMTAWDSTGRVLRDGDVVGGNGSLNLVFRVEDDPFGYVEDFLDGPVQELIQPVKDDIARQQQQIAALGPQVDSLQAQLDSMNPGDPAYAAVQLQLATARRGLQDAQAQLLADQEVLREFEQALSRFREVDLVKLDPGNGDASITGQMEITGFDWVKPRASFFLTGAQPLLSQKVDHVWPTWFDDPDGHPLDSISAWLKDVAGVPAPDGIDAANVCGTPTVDGWGYVGIKCAAPGDFFVNVTPFYPKPPSTVTSGSLHLTCPGVVDSGAIAAAPDSLEVQPVGANGSYSILTVTTLDQAGKRIDGGHVLWQTDNCTFAQAPDGSTISPSAGGAIVQNYSNTYGSLDQQLLTQNPGEKFAGTAEVVLDCSDPARSHAGTANVQAVVDRPGADVVLSQAVKVVGPPASIALQLEATGASCGYPVKATAIVKDAAGNPVSDGSLVQFTTDANSGAPSVEAGDKGETVAVGGVASVTLATDGVHAGSHTVTASTGGTDKNGRGIPVVQASLGYTCGGGSSAVEAAVSAAPPSGAVGGSRITPPNTGDAGLASSRPEQSRRGFAVIACAPLLLITLAVRRRRTSDRQHR